MDNRLQRALSLATVIPWLATAIAAAVALVVVGQRLADVPAPTLALGIGAVAITGLVATALTLGWLRREVAEPLQQAEAIAMQVARGELPDGGGAGRLADREGGRLVVAVQGMVQSLRDLVRTIQLAASEAAGMAQQIAAATEQMTASTQEVAGTTSELTERANQQAALVREAADDAARILAIARQLADGAVEAAQRNADLAALARRHEASLDASAAALARLTAEVELGAAEADALAAASTEIEGFVTQTKAIAKRTQMLALNAAIEAARAGEEGKGFSVVADEVRKLAVQAAQSATQTSETVQVIQGRVQQARERLLRLGEGGIAARDAAHAAAAGLQGVAREAEANDAWTRRISTSASEVRELVDGIAGRMREISAGTEDYAAAAQEISAAAEELNASTEEVSAAAAQLATAAERLTATTGNLRLA